MKKLGIYVHIPFCRQKCNYCDFYSVKWDEQLENKYVNAVIKEINSYKELKNLNYSVDTVYFGGGTPTIINPINIIRVIEAIKDTFIVDKLSEISIEANPNTLSSENLSLYKEAGFNRLSIGIQSLNDDILCSIGRLHNSDEALKAIELSKSYGFDNLNADVMFNIPGQKVSDIINTLAQIAERKVKHISFYSLKLEKGTPMYIMKKDNKIIMPDEDEEREMYYEGRNIMEKYNLLQYEISNFSEKGYECKHNLKYWNQEEYIGFGPSAHSFLNRKRFSNTSDINLYCTDSDNNIFNKIIQEILDDDALIFEYIMLNLRLKKGLDIKDFSQKFSVDFNKRYESEIKFLINNKLLEYNENSIKLTNRGMDISNYVFQKFMPL